MSTASFVLALDPSGLLESDTPASQLASSPASRLASQTSVDTLSVGTSSSLDKPSDRTSAGDRKEKKNEHFRNLEDQFVSVFRGIQCTRNINDPSTIETGPSAKSRTKRLFLWSRGPFAPLRSLRDTKLTQRQDVALGKRFESLLLVTAPVLADSSHLEKFPLRAFPHTHNARPASSLPDERNQEEDGKPRRNLSVFSFHFFCT